MYFILIELYPLKGSKGYRLSYLIHGWVLSIFEHMNSTNYDSSSLLTILAIQRERMNNDLFL